MFRILAVSIISTVNVKLDWNGYVAALRPKGRLHLVGATLETLYRLLGRQSEPRMSRFLAAQLARSYAILANGGYGVTPHLVPNDDSPPTTRLVDPHHLAVVTAGLLELVDEARLDAGALFEHPPVVEDCLICHNPHGSPNRRLLQLAQPMQCVQCHSLVINLHGGTNLNGAQMRNCVNCHSAIHGGHSDPYLKY